MKDHRRRNTLSRNRFFWCIISFLFTSLAITSFAFSTLQLFRIKESFRPNAVLPWPAQSMEAKLEDDYWSSGLSIRETVLLPDYALIFLNYPPSSRLYTKHEIDCVYFSAKSPRLYGEPPQQVDYTERHGQVVRCPLMPRGFNISISVKSNGHIPVKPSNLKWDPLVYEALIDRDNITIVFVKGLNLRPERLAEPSGFECVYGWDFKRPNMLLKSDAVSIAQEIVRCRTPLSLLIGLNMKKVRESVKVSVRVRGRGIFPSIARPAGFRLDLNPKARKKHRMCVCSMLRNQARFVKEWVIYHTRIGVQRWFIYDNNSDDDINDVIESLQGDNYNITRHVWPWIKTQEAGFAHCALRARDVCKWIGFIDVDEFFNVRIRRGLQYVIRNHSRLKNVGEIRTPCYSFGPSGLKKVPRQGVMVGYTCRLTTRERHKSIVRPEALNSTLINVVHHFHLKQGFVTVDVDSKVMMINHYKYQVWEVFKEKFRMRVATFVADWKEELNVGSNDRVPGLGNRAIEPPDWSSRFCEVRDVALRKWVLNKFADRQTHLLPWQPEYEDKRRERGFL
ncbi:hypothetical protein L6164_005019 [Bauhinia variegata]|uniref:Uncharacterized protein n=1 Tax=Bauhinia variegata TaxID=167791 RepID=A0ACB9PPT3_BAUVA|nr:hypothetical protein L6164_005019 [Bauhinia variegata]